MYLRMNTHYCQSIRLAEQGWSGAEIFQTEVACKIQMKLVTVLVISALELFLIYQNIFT